MFLICREPEITLRLADTKRNELIANFRKGKEDSEYEVIPGKTTKG